MVRWVSGLRALGRHGIRTSTGFRALGRHGTRTSTTTSMATLYSVGTLGKMLRAANSDTVQSRHTIWTSSPRCRMLASTRGVYLPTGKDQPTGSRAARSEPASSVTTNSTELNWPNLLKPLAVDAAAALPLSPGRQAHPSIGTYI